MYGVLTASGTILGSGILNDSTKVAYEYFHSISGQDVTISGVSGIFINCSGHTYLKFYNNISGVMQDPSGMYPGTPYPPDIYGTYPDYFQVYGSGYINIPLGCRLNFIKLTVITYNNEDRVYAYDTWYPGDC